MAALWLAGWLAPLSTFHSLPRWWAEELGDAWLLGVCCCLVLTAHAFVVAAAAAIVALSSLVAVPLSAGAVAAVHLALGRAVAWLALPWPR